MVCCSTPVLHEGKCVSCLFEASQCTLPNASLSLFCGCTQDVSFDISPDSSHALDAVAQIAKL